MDAAVLHRVRNTMPWKWLELYILATAAVYIAAAIALQAPADWEFVFGCSLWAGGNMALQGMFVALVGPSRYIRPIGTWRLAVSSIYVGTLLSLLVLGVLASVAELARYEEPPGAWLPLAVWISVIAALVGWCRRLERLAVLERISVLTLAASLMQLLAVIPMAHANRHGPGFLPGIASAIAAVLGTSIFAWSLGPLMTALYLGRLRRRQKGCCPACGYELRGLSELRCPECGRAFTFGEVRSTAEEMDFRPSSTSTPQ